MNPKRDYTKRFPVLAYHSQISRDFQPVFVMTLLDRYRFLTLKVKKGDRLILR
jgi:hypothetical protein